MTDLDLQQAFWRVAKDGDVASLRTLWDTSGHMLDINWRNPERGESFTFFLFLA